jgi:hypothetical protein
VPSWEWVETVCACKWGTKGGEGIMVRIRNWRKHAGLRSCSIAYGHEVCVSSEPFSVGQKKKISDSTQPTNAMGLRCRRAICRLRVCRLGEQYTGVAKIQEAETKTRWFCLSDLPVY